MNLLPLKTKKKSFNSSQRFFRAFHILIYNKITSLTLELKILSLRNKGIFEFSFFWGVIVGFVKGDNIIYHLIIIIFVEKVVVACFQWVGGAVHFGWCVRRLLAVKNMFSPRHFILCHVLFFRWFMSFFPFHSFSRPKNTKSIPDFCWCFTIHPLSFDFFDFSHFLFY